MGDWLGFGKEEVKCQCQKVIIILYLAVTAVYILYYIYIILKRNPPP